jgi:hypothetical protein
LKHLKLLLVIVIVIIILDYVTAPDPNVTFWEAFFLTFFTYFVKEYFEADPYALAGTVEYLSLIVWLFGVLWRGLIGSGGC